MLFYVLMIATLNLGVGFAVAGCLGRGPRMPTRESMLEWLRYFGWFALDRLIHLRLPKLAIPTRAGKTSSHAAAAAPTFSQPATAAASPKVTSSAANITPSIPVAAPSAPAPAPVEEAANAASPAAETAPLGPATAADALDMSMDEASVEDMMAGLMQFRDKVASLDTKVRKCARKPESREVQECVTEFKQANGDFLAKSEEISGRLSQEESSDEAAGKLRDKMKQAVQAQADEVRQASQTLEHIDVEGDPEAGCQAMLSQSGNLIASSSKLKDELTQTHIELAGHEGRSIERDDLLTDELTQLPTRIALEKQIGQLLIDSSSLAMALVDIDRLSKLNDEFGAQLGDRLLRGVARAIGDSVVEDCVLARFEGQRFALLFANHNATDVCIGVEELRQQLEAVRFHGDEESLAITASCAVADLQPTEALPEFYTRIESALNEAKRFGRNRTFIHNGRSPAPVVPPTIQVIPRAIEI